MNRKNKCLIIATVVVCIAASIGLVGCNSNGVSDQALATDIKAKLSADQNARTAHVNVDVANGVVKLTGDAPNSDAALAVVNIANGTQGVKSVDNELKIAPPPATASTEPPPGSTPGGPAPSSLASSSPAPPPPGSKPSVPENAVPPPPSGPPVEMRNENVPHEPPKPVSVTVPVGTDIQVRMIDGISSKTNTAGQTFRASLASPVVVHGRTVLPTGSDATVLLDAAKGAGRIKGQSGLQVRIIKIEHHGQSYDVDTSVHEEQGKGRGKQTAVRSGIGAAAGAVIGAIAGGGKGAAIGTLAGGGAGAGYQLATHGEQVSIPSETLLTFQLQAPFVVTLSPRR